MTITVPLFGGREFALLDPTTGSIVRSELGQPVIEGELITMPTIPEGHELACLFQQRGQERLALMGSVQDAKDIQAYDGNSDFRWHVINPASLFDAFAVA